MKKINQIQNEFFSVLKDIQDNAVCSSLNDYNKGDDIEDLLYDVTYETIYRIMEMIDGYSYCNLDLELDLIDRKSNESLRAGIELHDTCANYIKYEK